MNNLINWLENSFAPKMNKFNHNTWVVTIKDSIMTRYCHLSAGIPVLCGNGYRRVCDSALFLLDTLWVDNGMISVLVSFLIPFNFCEKKRLRKQRIIAGATGLIYSLYPLLRSLSKQGNRGLVPVHLVQAECSVQCLPVL